MRRSRLWVALSVLISMLLALSGCGGGAGSGSAGNDGGVMVSVTDAPGDFAAYDVRIVDVKMTRPNGAAVQTLPVNARVDFNGLTQSTELIAVGSVPQGEYTGVVLRLDFSDAEVWVEKDGAPVKAVTVDGEGNALGLVEMPVTFNGNSRMQINHGRMKDMTLDFNLAATNSVDMSGETPVVTVNPFLVAEVEPNGPKGMVARGPLLSTDPDGNFFTMGVRPRGAAANMGVADILVDGDTVYEVDGVAGTGAEGFALLAAKGVGTAVVAEGRMGMRPSQQRGGNMGGGMGNANGYNMGNGAMDNGMGNGSMGNRGMGNGIDDRGFLASRVRAGTSVQGGDRDALRGVVTARVGDTLTVSGGIVDRSEETIFGATAMVLLGGSTEVTKDGSALPAETGDISMGQRVCVLGSFDAEGGVMDATSGIVRMEYTRVAGVVTEATPPAVGEDGSVTLAVERLGGLAPEEFNFAGTGATPEEDADPSAYAVDTASFDLTDVLYGDPVVAVGFPAPFGFASPDFLAVTLVDMSAVQAELNFGWMPASATALTAVNENSLTANAAGTGLMRSIRFGEAALRLPEDAVVLVVPADGGDSAFAISEGMAPPTVYATFSEFSSALSVRLGEGELVAALFGRGTFEPTGMIFTADRLMVRLQ